MAAELEAGVPGRWMTSVLGSYTRDWTFENGESLTETDTDLDRRFQRGIVVDLERLK